MISTIIDNSTELFTACKYRGRLAFELRICGFCIISSCHIVSRADGLPAVREVGWRVEFPTNEFLGFGMLETQPVGMQHRAFSGTSVGQWRTFQGAVIKPLATQGYTCFTKVNTDLVGAARVELAFHKGEIVGRFTDGNMRDGAFRIGMFGIATAPAAVATFRNEYCFNLARLGHATSDGHVSAFDTAPAASVWPAGQ